MPNKQLLDNHLKNSTKFMYSLKKSILFGFLVWLLPFIVAFLMYPIHESNRPLFESIMPLVITISVVVFSYLYFKSVEKNIKAEGAKLEQFLFKILIFRFKSTFGDSPVIPARNFGYAETH